MLDYTPCEEITREAVTINPAKICQPIGAVYAALGVHNCMPHSHGSQGCLSYLRMCLSRHYRENSVATTSSFSEGTAVFGGAANLKEALENMTTIYRPDVIAIHTTCVAETIGDDVGSIVEDIRAEELIDPSIKICAASTPSYVGTHITGYDNMVKSLVTIALCRMAGGSAAKILESRYKIPAKVGPTPIGIRNTDRFIMNAAKLASVAIPPELEDERGRLVDMMTDAHPHYHGKKVAIYGDPDIIGGLTSLILEMGMEPSVVLTGTQNLEFENEMGELIGSEYPEDDVIPARDLYTLHQIIKRKPVDLLIGNTYGKFIARAEDVPLIRVGFPIMDRANLHYFPIMGYAGTARMVERIGNTLLDRKDRDAPDWLLETIQ